MGTKSHCKFLDRLRSRLRELRDANGANVTVTFALATVPIIGFVGASIDYSRANSVKAAMQAAADTTALMLSKDATTLSAAQMQTKANEIFKALLNRPEATGLTVAAAYSTSGGSKIKVDAVSTVKTDFMQMMGFSNLTVKVDSQVVWGNTKMRVALALDTTGSMDSDGKMAALKTATKSLLTTLKNSAATNGDVYVSIIPFSKDVNRGSSNYNASWIDWTAWEGEPPYMSTWLADNNNKTTWEQTGPGDDCPFEQNKVGFRCTSGPSNSASNANSIPSSGSYSGYICPGMDNGKKVAGKASVYYNGCYNSVAKPSKVVATGSSASCSGLPNCSCSGSGSSKKCTQTFPGQYTHEWIKNNRNTWNGCVMDRDQDYDVKNTAPSTGVTATLFPAEQHDACPAETMALSYDWNALNAKVDSLYPAGMTNQVIGLAWAFQSLTASPFTIPAKDPNFKYSDVIILVTDGDNTQTRFSNDKTTIDNRELTACANAKAAGVTVYTLQINTGGDATQTFLKTCASAPDKFIEVKSSSQVLAAFNAIGTALSNLRIAQ